MSMCRVVSCVTGRGCLLWPVHSVGKTVSLWPASFCNQFVRPNLPVIPGVSWLLLLYSSPPWWKGHLFFFGVRSRRSCRSQRIVQLQLLWHYWLGDRLGLLWCWMVCIGNELRSFCCFWDCIQELHFGLFLLIIRVSSFLLSDSCAQ